MIKFGFLIFLIVLALVGVWFLLAKHFSKIGKKAQGFLKPFKEAMEEVDDEDGSS